MKWVIRYWTTWIVSPHFNTSEISKLIIVFYYISSYLDSFDSNNMDCDGSKEEEMVEAKIGTSFGELSHNFDAKINMFKAYNYV